MTGSHGVEEVLPIFVYGTLQRGEERSACWPFPPAGVEWATLRGRIRDLGPYPALVPGDDCVLGELWHIVPEHLPATLQVLDEIECSGKDDVDLYVRRVVECRTLSGVTRHAYVYFLADPAQARASPVVVPDARGYCHWRRRAGRAN